MSPVDFFDRLVSDPPRQLRHLTATVRFDLDEGNGGTGVTHWLLTMDQGTLRVSHRRARADAVIRADRRLFEQVVTGRANPMAATLRGELSVEGDPQLLVRFQRAIPEVTA